jgi:K+-sensing histidine kinase KdpD
MGPQGSKKQINAMKQGSAFSDFTVKLATVGSCVALCIGVEYGLEICHVTAPYLIFLPAIAGTCAIGGLGTALWAIFFSTIGLWYFFIPPYGFSVPDYTDFAHLCVFVGVSCFVCWVIDSLRRTNDELSRDNVALGCKVSTLLMRYKARQ